MCSWSWARTCMNTALPGPAGTLTTGVLPSGQQQRLTPLPSRCCQLDGCGSSATQLLALHGLQEGVCVLCPATCAYTASLACRCPGTAQGLLACPRSTRPMPPSGMEHCRAFTCMQRQHGQPCGPQLQEPVWQGTAEAWLQLPSWLLPSQGWQRAWLAAPGRPT